MVWTSALRFHIVSTYGKPESLKRWWEGIWYHLKPWKSSHFPALRFHGNGRLSDFLPSYLPLLTIYKYWQNPADSVSLNPSSFCAPFFCLIFFLFPFFIFCYYLFHAVVWMIVMLKFWLLGLLIWALTFGSILTEALLPLSCCGVDDSFDCCGF